jgi:hypothetical protein
MKYDYCKMTRAKNKTNSLGKGHDEWGEKAREAAVANLDEAEEKEERETDKYIHCL